MVTKRKVQTRKKAKLPPRITKARRKRKVLPAPKSGSVPATQKKRKTPKKKRNYPEFQVQCRLASLLRLYYPEILWFAIPNGGRRAPREAERFKAMGVLSGVYDIFVSEPTPVFPGFYLEAKAPKGSLSKTQKEFGERARERGYHTSEFKCHVDGLKQVEEYMGVPQEQRVSSRLKPKMTDAEINEAVAAVIRSGDDV